MSKIKIQLVEDTERPSIWEKIWHGFLELMVLVGMVATACFAVSYFSDKQTQCEPNKTGVARSIFK